MDKKEVVAFFDSFAASWDANQVRNEEVIGRILDLCGIRADIDVLDVACGTGVLFSDYLQRGVKSVTGVDISEEMLRIAREKYSGVKLICGDAETFSFSGRYDAVMIYNAFPHFSDADKLFENLSRVLKKGGRLTVAHGMSEKELEKCHSGIAKNVSSPLPSKEKLAELMSPYVRADILISDESMYMVSGVKE